MTCARPRARRPTGRACRRRPEAVPGLDGGDVGTARGQAADLDLAGPLGRSRLLVARCRAWSRSTCRSSPPIEQENAFPGGQHDLVAAVVCRSRRVGGCGSCASDSSATSTGQVSFAGLGGHVVDQHADALPFAPVRPLRAAALERGDDELLLAGALDVAPPQAVERGLVEPDRVDLPGARSSRGPATGGCWPGRCRAACQPAPRAKSIRPSPSMSWGWMQTLSFAVDAPDDVVLLPGRVLIPDDGVLAHGHDVELAVAVDVRRVTA